MVEEQSFMATIHQKTDPALLQFCLFSCFLSQVEPKKASDALQDPSWVEAMQEELLQFKIQKVWTLVDCTKGVRPIGTKWVLKNKKDESGIVVRNKARLVAQGHTQEEGIDYDEVFAPVARIEAIRLFLAYASFMGFTVYQMDVKSAFLYGTIDEEVYVMQPPGFHDPAYPAKGEGSGTPTEPHHTPFPEVESSHPTTSSIPLPSIPTAPIPTVTQPDTISFIQYSRRARIAQSSTLPTVADEHASPVIDVSKGEACPTASSFIADQDRATIVKSSTLPHDSAPRVTSTAADEGSMQQNIFELTALCTSLQRQYSELMSKFQAQEEEIGRLKEQVQVLEDREGVATKQSGEDAPIKGRSNNEGDAAAKRISNDSEEIARVLTSMDAATVLAGEIDVPAGSVSFLLLQKRKYYMTVIKSNLGWRFKDFKGMTFEEIEVKFAEVWKQVEDFIPMGSKEKSERLKRKGLNLEKEQVKKQKSSEEAPEIETTTKEFTEEKIKEMMQLVPVEDVYVHALQVKHPIIDWKVHSEGQRSYWQIIRLGGSSACYQFFVDLLRQLDREDLNQL
nr:putative ribonuclease H-like domain-containing protein [Tanacetum cinerariifolium]